MIPLVPASITSKSESPRRAESPTSPPPVPGPIAEVEASPDPLARVEAVVKSYVDHVADVDLVTVARELGTSKRTLQRLLAARGTTFRAVVQRIRRDLAQELLSSSALTVEKVSFAVGYADSKALRRAFRRWDRPAPSRYRALSGKQPAASGPAMREEAPASSPG